MLTQLTLAACSLDFGAPLSRISILLRWQTVNKEKMRKLILKNAITYSTPASVDDLKSIELKMTSQANLDIQQFI